MCSHTHQTHHTYTHTTHTHTQATHDTRTKHTNTTYTQHKHNAYTTYTTFPQPTLQCLGKSPILHVVLELAVNLVKLLQVAVEFPTALVVVVQLHALANLRKRFTRLAQLRVVCVFVHAFVLFCFVLFCFLGWFCFLFFCFVFWLISLRCTFTHLVLKLAEKEVRLDVGNAQLCRFPYMQVQKKKLCCQLLHQKKKKRLLLVLFIHHFSFSAFFSCKLSAQLT